MPPVIYQYKLFGFKVSYHDVWQNVHKYSEFNIRWMYNKIHREIISKCQKYARECDNVTFIKSQSYFRSEIKINMNTDSMAKLFQMRNCK